MAVEVGLSSCLVEFILIYNMLGICVEQMSFFIIRIMLDRFYVIICNINNMMLKEKMGIVFKYK
ncbi:hypothetical protein BJV40_005162 [Clostridium beijerinckii]|nr:hypothetical protein [Clostridium beijerinckii]